MSPGIDLDFTNEEFGGQQAGVVAQDGFFVVIMLAEGGLKVAGRADAVAAFVTVLALNNGQIVRVGRLVRSYFGFIADDFGQVSQQ